VEFSKRVHETFTRLLNVYKSMAANNKTQMVSSHDNCTIVSKAVARVVNSPAFNEVHSSDYRLTMPYHSIYHIIVLLQATRPIYTDDATIKQEDRKSVGLQGII